jgi:diphosphoinositol-polyphosphate diphosphatase
MLQGGWEDDESIDEAACREAFEEAGVKGIISVGALTNSWRGTFFYYL